MNRTITYEKYQKLQEAAYELCHFCENDECADCIVTLLLDDAYDECPEAQSDEDYEDDDF